ncbi:MAG: hypothetical protein IT244_01245 [Bacteroidia bacterium]|nr:hypothetical protein [Bacteroidia bacterium]
MKKYFTSILCVCTLAVQAQKVDLDRFNFNFEYRNLPHHPLDSTFKTYSVLLDAPYTVTGSMGADAIASRIVLQGFDRVDSDGDVRTEVHIQDLIIDKYQVVENSSTTKNKDGSETKTYSYYVSVDYNMQGHADWFSSSGVELSKGINLFGSRSYNWASATYKTRSEATNYYYNNKNAIVNNLIRERVNEAIASANSHMNYQFGYPVTTEASYFWLLDSKKHPENEPMSLRWKALKPALEGVSANSLSEDTKSKMMEMIKYFDGIKTTYAEDDKGHKKMRYAAFYNNALLYLMLDMPEKAIEEANGLIANDYDEKDGERLAKRAEELMALFTLNHTQNRHFTK